MEPPRPNDLVPSRKSRWFVWLTYLACWTAALVVPIPSQDPWRVTSIDIDLKFLVAKTLHVGGYAVLAGLTGWLRLPQKSRWLMMFFLMSQGTLTELIQELMPGRNGELHDVAFDQLGVALGLALTWKWWRRPVG